MMKEKYYHRRRIKIIFYIQKKHGGIIMESI